MIAIDTQKKPDSTPVLCTEIVKTFGNLLKAPTRDEEKIRPLRDALKKWSKIRTSEPLYVEYFLLSGVPIRTPEAKHWTVILSDGRGNILGGIWLSWDEPPGWVCYGSPGRPDFQDSNRINTTLADFAYRNFGKLKEKSANQGYQEWFVQELEKLAGVQSGGNRTRRVAFGQYPPSAFGLSGEEPLLIGR